MERGHDRWDAVGAGSRTGEESVGDLALYQHHEAIDVVGRAERVEDDPRSDVVWQVRDERPRPWTEVQAQVNAARVGVPNLDVGEVAHGVMENPHESGVDFVHHDAGTRGSEAGGQCSGPAADLCDVGVRSDGGETHDALDDVRIDEKILAVGLIRSKAEFVEKAPDGCPPLRRGFRHAVNRRHGSRSQL